MYFAAKLPSQAHMLQLEAWAKKSCAEHIRPATLELHFRRSTPTSVAAMQHILRNLLSQAGPLAEKGWLRMLSAEHFMETVQAAQEAPVIDVGEKAREPAIDAGEETQEPATEEAREPATEEAREPAIEEARAPATDAGEEAQEPATDAAEAAPTEAVETRHGTSRAIAAPARRNDLLVIEFPSLVSADFVQRAAEMRCRLLGGGVTGVCGKHHLQAGAQKENSRCLL
jgi:hypothetical protein